MQSEVSIAKQLSGSECLESCLSTLRAALAKDDRFQDHMAYPGYRAEIVFKFWPHQSYIPEVERTVEVEHEFTGFDEVAFLKAPDVDLKVEIPVRPPNVVREEASIAQPVLVTDGRGQSHEEWKKVDKKPPAQKVPHNKVVGR